MAVQFNVFLDRRREWRWQLQDTETEVPLADSVQMGPRKPAVMGLRTPSAGNALSMERGKTWPCFECNGAGIYMTMVKRAAARAHLGGRSRCPLSPY
jgi:hypothetical protein